MELNADYYLQYYDDTGTPIKQEPFIPNDGVHNIPSRAAFVRLKIVAKAAVQGE